MLALILGIVSKPSATLDQIAGKKAIISGLLIWVVTSSLYIITINFMTYRTFDDNVMVTLLIQPKNLLKIFAVFVYTFLQNWVATRYIKIENRFGELLACNLFILVIEIISLSSSLLLAALGLRYANFLNIIFVPWAAILQITAIKHIYKLSTASASKVFLLSLGMIILLSIGLKFVQ